jgi:hypothetical protein
MFRLFGASLVTDFLLNDIFTEKNEAKNYEKTYVAVWNLLMEFNSVISKLMTFVENAESSQFLFFIMSIFSYFTCS